MQTEVETLRAALAESQAEVERLKNPKPLDEWHEDMGPMIWWRFPIKEPPYCGSPLDEDWTDDYFTHFTPIPKPHQEGGD